MVKGTSRQIIVVEAPEPKLFDQAIFILKDNVGEGISDEALLKEAQQAIRGADREPPRWTSRFSGALWACAGAFAVGLIWMLTVWI